MLNINLYSTPHWGGGGGGGGGGEGVLSLNTCGDMMFWQRGPTFTFLIGDTVSVMTSSHQRNTIEFAGKPIMAQH